MARVIDGKVLASGVRAEVKAGAVALRAASGVIPGLAVVRVGEDPASKIYVGGKRKAAAEAGFNAWEHHFPATANQAEVLDRITQLNAAPEVHGILVQLPLPPQLDGDALIRAVRPEKDVDGFHPLNAGNLLLGRPTARACTPAGVMVVLEHTGVKVAGAHAVVVGRSNIVGKPMALMLLHADATVTVCHRKSDLAAEIPRADILVAAVGVPGLVKGEWIKPGAVVIDVGMNRLPDGTLRGDVEYEAAAQRASWITPVPGGVGPMTIALLLRNTLDAARRAARA
ncbi:MAG: bifunctional methylenetetrahydrofolate dehydrogenase/methenyltetrahydrofolate cyclohydrolase FolD [Deltaproteobacteria bacterium]|nr:bifunctional methylenetetrahydrofolate dehydrogenase/methenyltetrahydrofolate cyclohydrolase FolD [Deltaproteobacteria bacterium]